MDSNCAELHGGPLEVSMDQEGEAPSKGGVISFLRLRFFLPQITSLPNFPAVLPRNADGCTWVIQCCMMMARSTVGNGGFAQGYLIDYNKTMAPTARLEPFRSLLHIAAILD
jgi:hypothetical protein